MKIKKKYIKAFEELYSNIKSADTDFDDGIISVLEYGYILNQMTDTLKSVNDTISGLKKEILNDLEISSKDNGSFHGLLFKSQSRDTFKYENIQEIQELKDELKEKESFYKKMFAVANKNPDKILKDENENYYFKTEIIDEETGNIIEKTIPLPTKTSSTFLKVDKSK